VRSGKITWEFPVDGERPEPNQVAEAFPR
jgi:hypothetical protein